MTTNRIHGNCIDIIKDLDRPKLIIADPPYGNIELINTFISIATRRCMGAVFVFEYAENIRYYPEPSQILFWIKQPSTKNTSRRYSRFVEVILVYNLDYSPFHNIHWSAKTGVFMDSVIELDHPFKKPESLIEKIIKVNSSENDLVLDPFAGSYTVETVCFRTNRNCISIQI